MANSPFEGAQENLSHQRYCGTKWSFQSGAFSVYQKELSSTCGEGDLNPKIWIHLCWFLGIKEYSWKYFLELQTPLVFCKMSEGDPNTRWNDEGDFPVLSPQRE